MDIQTNTENPQQVRLDANDQKHLVNYVVDCWKRGKDERKDWDHFWTQCEKSYKCEADPLKDKRLEWRTNIYLPWAYDAVESCHSYLHSMLLPKEEDVFSVDGRTPDDNPANEVMTDYLQYVFKNNGLAEKFSEYLKPYIKKGPSVLKVYWREDKRVYTELEEQPVIEEQFDPLIGQVTPVVVDVKKVKVQREATSYNNVWFDVIDIKDFVFYPVCGDIDKTTRIHQTYKYLDELKAQADNLPYFNLSELENEEQNEQPYSNNVVDVPDYEFSKEERDRKRGLNIKEAWIHRVKIGGKIYKNYIATVVNDKYLIRFQPNPYEMGRSPFIYDCMIPDGQSLLGHGLLTAGAIDILKYANFLASAKADTLKLAIYGGHKYTEDGVFNPYNFVSRPGMLVKVGNLENLVPLYENLAGLQLAYTEVAELKAEFEEVTVPKVVKGQVEASQRTATEIQHAQNNASGKMHQMAYRLNERVLKPLLEMAYLLIRERAQMDPRVMEDIARVTQPSRIKVEGESGETREVEVPIQDLAKKLPPFLPLPEVDIKVVGYQNAQRKQEALVAIERTIPQLAQSPAGQYIKWPELAEEAFRLQNLPSDKLIMGDEERAQVDQQAQQAQQQAMELERMKEEGKLQVDMMKIELDKLKIELEYAKLGVEQENRQMEMMMGAAQKEEESKNVQS